MSEKQRITNYYEEKLAQFGADPRSVGWRDRDTQRRRFEALTAVAPLQGKSILDLGCGLGDFYSFLNEKNIACDYTGWDLSGKMIDACRQKYPGATFDQVDVLCTTDEHTFDVVFGSGLFCIPLEDETFYERIMARMFAMCREAAAFNMISAYVDYREDYLRYADPCAVFDFCKKNLSRYVALRHDYMPFEFTVYVYRRD